MSENYVFVAQTPEFQLQMAGLEWISHMFLPFLVMIYSCSPQQSPGLGLSGCSISQNRVRRAADSKPTHVVCLASHRADTKTFFFFKWDHDAFTDQNIWERVWYKAHWSFSSSFKMQPLHRQVFTWCMCVYQLYTHTHKVELAKCSILRVISGYPIMLLYCTAWENLRDLVAWLLWLWGGPSRWRAAESQDPPSPFSNHLHPFMCLHPSLLPLPPPSSFSSPFFFSPVHYQEGQPVEAPVSPTPSQQGLEAASAATVSQLTPAKPMFV